MINSISYPSMERINDYIDSELCSVNYSTFDDTLKVISAKGEKAIKAEINIPDTDDNDDVLAKIKELLFGFISCNADIDLMW